MGGNPGSGTYTAPAGGYSSAKGAGIGAGVAGGAGILFLTLHYRGRVTGCVQPADDGLRLHDQKKNRSYALVSGEVYLKPGQLVELQGHKSKNQAGAETFTAQKLIKDPGLAAPHRPSHRAARVLIESCSFGELASPFIGKSEDL